MLDAAQAALARRLQARDPNVTLRVNPPGRRRKIENDGAIKFRPATVLTEDGIFYVKAGRDAGLR